MWWMHVQLIDEVWVFTFKGEADAIVDVVRYA
jgi:hypothetical protein